MRHCCAPDPQHNTASLELVSPVPHEGPSAELHQDNQCAMQSSSISAAPYVFSKVWPVLSVLTMVLCSLLTDNSGLSTWVTWSVGGTLCFRRYQCGFLWDNIFRDALTVSGFSLFLLPASVDVVLMTVCRTSLWPSLASVDVVLMTVWITHPLHGPRQSH